MKGNLKKRKLLLVEDDSFIASAYQKGLEQEGFEVLTASSGDDALIKIANERPDLVLLDLVMAGRDGFSVLSEIKNRQELKKMPVIILSNLGGKEDIEKGKNLGASDYIIKSDHSLVEVTEKIRNCLSQ